MKALLDEKGFDRNQHKISHDSWYYEAPSGLGVFHNDLLIGVIRWRSLAASLRRYEARSKRRRPR